jgi:hypothetical protein
MSFPNIIFGREGAQYEIHATDAAGMGRHPWGTILITPDGRQFRYARAGGTIGAGLLCQSEVPEANWDELNVNTFAVGDKSLLITTGATAVDLNEIAGGYVNVEDDTGEGYMYRVASNVANAGSAESAFILDTGVKLAAVAATTVGLLKNPYRDFIIHPSPPTAIVIGVTQMAVVAGNCCWLQTKGPCSVLTEGTLVIGDSVQPSSSADGAVTPLTLTEGTPNTEIAPPVGWCMEVAATTEYSAIYLRID